MLLNKDNPVFDDDELDDLYFNYRSEEKKSHAEMEIQTEEIKYFDASTKIKKYQNSCEVSFF